MSSIICLVRVSTLVAGWSAEIFIKAPMLDALSIFQSISARASNSCASVKNNERPGAYSDLFDCFACRVRLHGARLGKLVLDCGQQIDCTRGTLGGNSGGWRRARREQHARRPDPSVVQPDITRLLLRTRSNRAYIVVTAFRSMRDEPNRQTLPASIAAA